MAGPALRILGIDPGLRITGFGIIEKSGSKLAYVANAVSGTVSVIDMETLQEVTQIPVGKGPKRNGVIRLPAR